MRYNLLRIPVEAEWLMPGPVRGASRHWRCVAASVHFGSAARHCPRILQSMIDFARNRDGDVLENLVWTDVIVQIGILRPGLW